MDRFPARKPQGLLAPVWPSRDYPISTMRPRRGEAWCETCQRNRPAPAKRNKGWKCRFAARERWRAWPDGLFSPCCRTSQWIIATI